MKVEDIIGQRLINQCLIGEKFDTPEKVVSWFGAIQAQDFSAAKWSIGQRMKTSTETIIESSFNDGKILRTHIMRPTWHFILPENLIWMQKLTSKNVKKLMGHYNRKLELNDDIFRKTEKIIVKTLRNRNYKTRQELKNILLKIGIKTDVQRLAHIVMWAELDCLICSGPKKGNQLTYALVEDRITKSIFLERDESLARLASQYFLSHGPAQLKDFSWWSGLSINDSLEALSLIKRKLKSFRVTEKEYFISKDSSLDTERLKSKIFLLSIFDEYIISYKDRSDLSLNKEKHEQIIPKGNTVTAVVIVEGKIAGSWRKRLKGKVLEINLSLFRSLDRDQKKSLEEQIREYEKFTSNKIVYSY